MYETISNSYAALEGKFVRWVDGHPHTIAPSLYAVCTAASLLFYATAMELVFKTVANDSAPLHEVMHDAYCAAAKKLNVPSNNRLIQSCIFSNG
jgi:hypothetical protein